jgi:formylmethanofuran dehydrogenase subunit E
MNNKRNKKQHANGRCSTCGKSVKKNYPHGRNSRPVCIIRHREDCGVNA